MKIATLTLLPLWIGTSSFASQQPFMTPQKQVSSEITVAKTALAWVPLAKSLPVGSLWEPIYTQEIVYARSSKTIYHSFRGRAYAELYFMGDGDTDVDYYVYDEDGNLVDSSEDYTDRAYLTWYVDFTQEYRIVIKNRSTSIYNQVTIMSN
jgi:hypothetical protein